EQLCPNRPPAEAEAHAKLRELIETVAALEVTGEIQRARAEPASMEVGLPDPQAILDFVLAAGRGEHGIDLLPDHQLRAELAGVTWSELAPLVMARSEPEQAYLQLRLAPVLPDVPQTPAPRRGVSEANLWIATALEWPEGSAWRLFGWLGDLSSAELALRSQLEPPAAPGTEDQPSASAPGHWSARVAGADPELGVVARLRAASGKRSLSLELWRAHAAVPARRAWVEDEIVRALAWGRPWHALAILDALPEAPQGALTEAVDAVLAVAEAVCGKPC